MSNMIKLFTSKAAYPRIFVVATLASAFWFATAPMVDAKKKDKGGPSGKCTVCHRTGKPGKFLTLEVSCNAVQAHINHGDNMGPCPPTPTANN